MFTLFQSSAVLIFFLIKEQVMSLSCMHHYPCCTDEEGEAKAESIQPAQDGMARTQHSEEENSGWL